MYEILLILKNLNKKGEINLKAGNQNKTTNTQNQGGQQPSNRNVGVQGKGGQQSNNKGGNTSSSENSGQSETNTEKTPYKKLPSNLIGLRPSYR